MTFGLPVQTLQQIKHCLSHYPQIEWVKIYGSRAMGNYKRGSDIDLVYANKEDISGKLLADLDELPTPYLFDVTHYNSLENSQLKEHIDRVGQII
jgi:predicted nucleotidyltransferase